MMSCAETSPKRYLLKAAWYWPGNGRVQRDASLFINGRHNLVDYNPYKLDAETIDLGDAIILPGLINSHTHLELSHSTLGQRPTSFVDWLLNMPRQRGDDAAVLERVSAATRTGIEQSLKFGVTCVGDISQQMHITRPVIADSPIRAISYGEVIGLGKRRSRFDELLPRAIDERWRSDRLTIGLSPHSPYTVEPADVRRCVDVAKENSLPLAMHLAETREEEEFLRSHTGPFRDLWERLGSWTDFEGTFDGTPVQFADAMGLLQYPTLLAHVNYCSDDDMELLSRGHATVAYCPRTHRYFNHPPHRWREMMARGINVVVGTDSCASSPDLNVVDELRLLHEIAPNVAVEDLWRMAIGNGPAYFTVFTVNTNDPLREILESDRLPKEVWIAGARSYCGTGASPVK